MRPHRSRGVCGPCGDYEIPEMAESFLAFDWVFKDGSKCREKAIWKSKRLLHRDGRHWKKRFRPFPILERSLVR